MGFVFISIADQNMNSQRSLPPSPLPHPPPNKTLSILTFKGPSDLMEMMSRW